MGRKLQAALYLIVFLFLVTLAGILYGKKLADEKKASGISNTAQPDNTRVPSGTVGDTNTGNVNAGTVNAGSAASLTETSPGQGTAAVATDTESTVWGTDGSDTTPDAGTYGLESYVMDAEGLPVETPDTAQAETPAALTQETAQAAAQGTTPGSDTSSGFSPENATLSDLEKRRQEAGLTEEVLNALKEQQAGLYYYECLDDAGKQGYAEILKVLRDHGEEILLSVTDPERLKTLVSCVLQDHPEIYYTDGYNVRTYRLTGPASNERYLTFGGRYIYTPEECAIYDEQLRERTTAFLAGAPAGGDYEKLLYTYEKLILDTEYVKNSRDNQNILSVLLYGQSVCQGYAKALQYLLQQQGMSASMVAGRVHGGEGHAWDFVMVDGAWYYVDPTWGDAKYMSQNGEKMVDDEINYNYFCITTEELASTHVINNVQAPPKCVAKEADYFVRNGRYFMAYDEAVLLELISGAASAGENISLKFATDTVYRQARKELLDGEKVFQVLGDGDRVQYSENKGLRIITFWF